MTNSNLEVLGGIDTHTDSHAAAAIDAQGRLLGTHEFPTTAAGYQRLAVWLHSFGRLRAVGIEGSGSYGAGLCRYLQAGGSTVVEVNRPHTHTRARRGKTDAVDAEATARKVLSGECTTIPKDTTGIVEAIRQLHLARASAVKARTSALNQLGELAITAPTTVRSSLTAKTLAGKANQAAGWRADRERIHDPIQAATLALRSIARRVRDFDEEIAQLDEQLTALVRQAAPHTLTLLGIGPVHAAQLLITAGQNIDRLHSDAAFARVCAAAPIPASSGKTTRHRLNPFGDRDANRTLHLITVVRLRYCDRTRAYADRRSSEGLSKREIIRCIKRYLAREIYHALRTDLQQLALPT